ncbi:hypothetical protein HMPREF0454_02534 [Hafnia alvei ATCC 51873]|uniref:Uncharacterized protein n=2 Tax=Hafniaceae TaxID=1903412 RepID=G9Y7I0_HAFAL|nr:hypothetical protein HMPREF0454_02534 [Hafnia alvei ATCC 51873]
MEIDMKHTLKVYKDSKAYPDYMKVRFDKTNTGKSFLFDGHRWAYEHSAFDDSGDYDLLYRFDDEPYPEEKSNSVDELTARDYFASKALGLCYADYLNYAAENGVQEGWRDGVAKDAYLMADAMLKARGE